MEDQAMKEKIQSIIDKEKKEKTGVLDFQECTFDAWPMEIFDMTWLRVLNMSGRYEYKENDFRYSTEWVVYTNRLTTIPNHFKNLINLEYLCLNDCNIQKVENLEHCKKLKVLSLRMNRISKIEGMYHLSELRALYLWDNIISRLQNLTQLKELVRLNLGGNQISRIENLETLTKLTYLNLESNRIKVIENISKLIDLDCLILGGNQIMQIENIEKLVNLEKLILGSNEISKLENLDSLTSLRKLTISNNNIKRLKNLESLTSLEELNLLVNQIESIENLGKLRKLKYLNLSSNLIGKIENLDGLDRLEMLDLFGNYIKVITSKQISTLKYLDIRENPIEGITSEELAVIGDDIEKLREKLKNFEQNNSISISLPVKVIAIGNSEDGKTSLCKFLIKDKSQFSESDDLSTHGLRIRTWREKAYGGYGHVDALIYDFGGQDYYHATYNMFFSQHALYVFLWNADRKNNEEVMASSRSGNNENFIPYIAYQPAYWLSNLEYYLNRFDHAIKSKSDQLEKLLFKDESIVEKSSLYIIGINNTQYANEQSSFYIDEHLLVDSSSALEINGQHNVNLIDDESFTNQKKKEALRAEIFDYTHTLSRFYPVFKDDASLVGDIIEKVRNGNNKYQRKLVKTFINKTKYKDDTYLKVLHRMGLVLYYSDNEKLNNFFWEDPSTVSQEIYRSLSQDCFSKDHGKIRYEDFKENVDGGLIDLMLAQEIIFLDEHSEVYVVPQFLAKDQNDPLYELAKIRIGNGFYLHFKRFLPHGLMSRLLCRFGANPGKKHYYRNEIIYSIALRKEDPLENQVKLSISLDPIKLLLSIRFSMPEQLNKEKDRLKRYLFSAILAAYYNHDHKTYQEWNQSGQNGKGQITDVESKEFYKDTDKSTWTISKIEQIVPGDLSISIDDKNYVDFALLCRDNEQRIVEAVNNENQESIFIKRAPFNPFLSAGNQSKPIKSVFISYAHEDMKYKTRLMTFLKNLERQNMLEVWHDGEISAGMEWDRSIKERVEKADIAILLISQDFIASSYIYEVEMRKTFKQLQLGSTKIIPVLLRACDWENYSILGLSADKSENEPKISDYQLIPHDENAKLKAINKWHDQDEAWVKVIDALKERCS